MDILEGVSNKELILSSGLGSLVQFVQVSSAQAMDSFLGDKFEVVSNGLMVSYGLGYAVPSLKVLAA